MIRAILAEDGIDDNGQPVLAITIVADTIEEAREWGEKWFPQKQEQQMILPGLVG